MEAFLAGIVFAGLIAGQFLAVVAVHNARRQNNSDSRDAFCGDDRAEHIWKFGG